MTDHTTTTELTDEPKRLEYNAEDVRYGDCEECDKRANLHPHEGRMICGGCSDAQYLCAWIEYARGLRALLVAPRAASVPAGWKPIEAAPKDGVQILLSNGTEVQQGWWIHDEGGTTEHRDMDGRWIGQNDRDGYIGWWDVSGGMHPCPDRWMPMPSALDADSAEPVTALVMQPLTDAALREALDEFELVCENDDVRRLTDDEKYAAQEFALSLFHGAPAAPVAEPAPAEGAELASMTRMFHAACAALGLINEALDLDPDDGGAEPILDAIQKLKDERDQWADAGYTAQAVAADAPHAWAPDRIWLQRGQGEDGTHTWHSDSLGDGDVQEAEYVRVGAQAVAADGTAPTAYYPDWPGRRVYAAEPHGFNEPGLVLDGESIKDQWHPLYGNALASVSPATATADERAAFLAWWTRDVPEELRRDWINRNEQFLREGKACEALARAWEGWQARASQAAAPASVPPFKRYNWDGKESETGALVFFLDVLEALKIAESKQAAAPAGESGDA